jgi:hypothetical protein
VTSPHWSRVRDTLRVLMRLGCHRPPDCVEEPRLANRLGEAVPDPSLGFIASACPDDVSRMRRVWRRDGERMIRLASCSPFSPGRWKSSSSKLNGSPFSAAGLQPRSSLFGIACAIGTHFPRGKVGLEYAPIRRIVIDHERA